MICVFLLHMNTQESGDFKTAYFLVITSVQLAGHGEKCLFDCHCVKLIIETQFEDIFRIVLLHKINSH